jgi:hypothetical protein
MAYLTITPETADAIVSALFNAQNALSYSDNDGLVAHARDKIRAAVAALGGVDACFALELPESTRRFDAARKAQGFKPQAHLDAFFRAYDHTSSCPVCSRAGGHMPLDDGMQPVMGRCAEGLRLERASWSDSAPA